MTIRALILGLLGAMFIVSVTYLHDQVWQLGNMVGSHLPIFVFGLLFLLILVVNPLLSLANRRWRLRPAEMGVGLMMLFAVCSIPGYGFFGAYPKATVLAAHYYPNKLGWNDNQLRERLPTYLVPGDGEPSPELTDAFRHGLGTKGNPMPMSEVPWRHWQKPLTVWLPIVAMMAVAVICLGLVLHKQWSANERLRYPIAEIATTLINQGPESGAPSLLRNRLFWLGLIVVLFIRFNNGIYTWLMAGAGATGGAEAKWINIPLSFDFTPIYVKFETIKNYEQWRNFIFNPELFPVVVGIAFLLASDVSLSLGLAPLAIMGVTVWFMASRGETIRVTDYMEGGRVVWQRFGSYVALAGVVLYVGRNYYWNVLKRTLGFGDRSEIEPYITRASRLFFIAVALLIFLLWRIGLGLPLAAMVVGLILLTHLGMARINCESGLFLNLPRWQPVGVMLGLMGAVAMGPQAILIVSLLSIVFTVGAWECLMPFFMNGLRTCTNLEVKPGRVGVSAIGVYVIGLAVAIPATLYVCYNYGSDGGGYWTTAQDELPSYMYHPADKAITEMKNAATLSESESYTSLQRMDPRNWKPEEGFLPWVGAGIVLVLIVSFCRLRFPWWPLHPIVFMVWGTRQMATLSFSFLVGWAIKSAVTSYGGSKAYQKTKYFMYGAIAGDLLGGMGFMVVSMIHHIVTGDEPMKMFILPNVV